MGRPQNKPTTIEHDSIDNNNQLNESINEMAAHSAAIIKQYGHDTPYSREHYLNKARGHIMRSAEEVLELGRCLIVMKEHEPQGEWLSILEDISIERTFAARTMQAAIKFAGASSSKNLIEAAKSKSKLFELMVLDDQQLEQLNDGETIAGINLDAIDKMPVSELRKALREAKEDIAAKDAVAQESSQKINELKTQIARIKKAPVDEHIKTMRAEITGLVSELDHDLRTNLWNAFEALRESEGDDFNNFCQLQLQELQSALDLLKEQFAAGEAWE